MIKVTDDISIREEDVVLTFSRSSGPGGQKVNKTSTRVTVHFDVTNSDSLTDQQKKRILKRLAGRVTKEGVVRVASQKFRTQKANRKAALEKLAELLSNALKTKPKRRKTSIPLRAKQHRLDQKKRRSRLKQQRKPPTADDGGL